MVVKESLYWILDRPRSDIEEMKKKWGNYEYRKHLGEYYDEKYRQLPYIGVLKESVYTK